MLSNLSKWQLAVRKAPRSRLAPGTKLVLLTLGTYMDAQLYCFPSTEELAAATGFSKRAVIEHLDKAAQAGFLQKSVKGRGGKGWSRHEYTGLVPGAATRAREGGDKSSPREADGGDKNDIKAVTNCHPNLSIELSKEEGQSPRRRAEEDGKKAEFIFEGRIIRLKSRDWEARKARYGLSDAQLARWLNDRDRWLRTLAPNDRRVVDWWHSTWKALEAEVAGILKSAEYAKEAPAAKPKERQAMVVWG